MRDRKVLLIGWDAADWKVAQPLIEQGKMPALTRLLNEGVWGNLATLYPILSPMLWTSIGTGKRAWKHGIHGFSEPCPNTGGIRPITSLSRKTKAVWNIFNQQGWKSNVIGWWPSHPVEPINGVMVSNHFQQAVKNLGEDWPVRPGTVHPERLIEPLKELRIHPAELENEHILLFIPRAAEIDQDKDKRMQSCAKVIAENSGIHAAATACLQLEPWDFMAVYYDGIDHFGHGFMRYHPPRQPWIKETDFEHYKNVIEAGYRFHDMMLDTLLKLAGEETTVMLISDHGFESGNLRPQSIPNEPAGPAFEHSPYGIFCLKGPGIKRGEQIHGASILDITPTLLDLYGLPVGLDMDGKALTNVYEKPEPPEFIDSWDEVPGEDGRHRENAQLDIADSRESIRQLVDLGYIDEPNPDRGKAVDETLRELQYNLAQAYMDGKRYTEAADILKGLWNQWPHESRFGTKLLSCFLSLENPVIARETYALLLERKAEASESAQEKIQSVQEELQAKFEKRQAGAEERGEPFEPDRADERLRKRLRKLRAQAATNHQALAFYEGSLLALEERYEEALESLERARDAQTANQPSLLNQLGAIYQRLGNLDEAESHFRQVLALDPGDPNALLGLAETAFARKDYFEAAGNALASLEYIFHNPAGHTLYARSLIQLNKPKLAEQSLLTAIRQNPNHAEAHETLAELYEHTLQKPDKAYLHRKAAVLALERIQAMKEGRVETSAQRPSDFPEIRAVSSRLIGGCANPLIVVSGLPRSGTSLMMQMLQAGGCSIVTDGRRSADDSNPKGYFELERVKNLPGEKDRSWLAEHRGKAIKVIAPLLGLIPKNIPLKVIFMQRPAKEILDSQRRMLEREKKPGAEGKTESLMRVYAAQLTGVNNLARIHPSMEIHPVDYLATVKNPLVVAESIARFLGSALDTKAMSMAADPELYRVKSD